jgi:two-component system, NarL family, nitrate/nitrite response regulator NarL
MKTEQLTSAISPTRCPATLLSPTPRRFAQVPQTSARNSTTSEPRSIGRTKGRIRVLLADDHPVVRRGVASCLARQAQVEIVGEAADGREALLKIKALLPDIVLMDIDMPHMSGLAVTEILRKDFPQIKVLILSMHQQSEYVERILQSGAHGYVLKEAPVEELLNAVLTVYAGEAFFSPEIARVALNRFVQGAGDAPNPRDVTPREREVLVKIAEGCSNKEIANTLGVGVRTIETHRERIMRKLDIHSIAGLTRFCIAKGLVTLREDVQR